MSAGSNVIAVSTAALPAADRGALVREFYGRIAMRLDLDPFDGGELEMDAVTTVLPGLSVSRGSVSPMAWERTRSLVGDGNDDVVISWIAGGWQHAPARGPATETAAGSACIMRMDEPWRAATRDGTWTFCVRLPRALIAPGLPHLDDLAAGALHPADPAARLLQDYVASVSRGPIGPALAALAARHIVDLATVALGAGAEVFREAASGVRAARLRALKQHVEENLSSPSLCAERAARATGLSPRHVRRLFAEEGRSFSDYVTERRLAHVRRRLAEPCQAHRTVADIAFEAGFAEPSTFYRQYRAAFGMRPSDSRPPRGG